MYHSGWGSSFVWPPKDTTEQPLKDTLTTPKHIVASSWTSHVEQEASDALPWVRRWASQAFWHMGVTPSHLGMYTRLRAVPLFSYSPSKAERKKQAAQKLLSGQKAKKKGTTDKASAFDLSRPSDFMVFISNLIHCNPILLFPLSWPPVNFGLSSLSSLSSISQSHFCVVGATHKSNAEALSVVPFFSPFVQTTAFTRPVFFAPLSTDYKKTKGLLVVYMYTRFHFKQGNKLPLFSSTRKCMKNMF